MADQLANALNCAAPDNPLLIVGSPGCGKSARVAQWAEQSGRRILVEHPVIAQSVDYRGLPAVVDGRAEWLPIGRIRDICDPDCPPTVVLIDDVGQAPHSVQAALMQPILARSLGDADVSSNVTFILATNQVTDRAGVRPILSALTNRVQVVKVESDGVVWAEWAASQKDVPPLVAAYARFRPDLFAKSVPEDTMQPFCTPRSLHAAARLMYRGINSFDMLAGWIGGAIAADYMAYADSVAKIDAIDTILDHPERAKVIKDHGLLHAIAAQASRRVKERGKDVARLANTLGGGWGVATMSAACAFHPAYKTGPDFRAWAMANKSLL